MHIITAGSGSHFHEMHSAITVLCTGSYVFMHKNKYTLAELTLFSAFLLQVTFKYMKNDQPMDCSDQPAEMQIGKK